MSQPGWIGQPKKRGQRRKRKRRRDVQYRCIVCETALSVKGGYGDTDMCGPCATGEVETLSEFGATW